MFTEMIMVLVVNIFLLLFSAALVHFDQSMLPLRSFKISENVTYDCIDIYKQPGLDHPLLKNHTIQMKPSFPRHVTGINITYKNKIGCSYGTVPILRNTKEYIAKAQLLSEKSVHLLSEDRHGTHIAGVRVSKGPYHAIKASFGGYDLHIGKHQASYSQIYISSELNNQVNVIAAGLMINQDVFGDRRVWSYGFWKGKDGKGCYNTACPGFVQTSHEVPLGQPFDLKPGVPVQLHSLIHQDKQTGDWWYTLMGNELLGTPNIDVGYWPHELFDLLSNGANMVGVGGVVHASHSGVSPPMGNGLFPIEGTDSAFFRNVELLDSNYFPSKIEDSPIEKLVDSPNCYGLRIRKPRAGHITFLDYFFFYGGPGGKSCEV